MTDSGTTADTTADTSSDAGSSTGTTTDHLATTTDTGPEYGLPGYGRCASVTANIGDTHVELGSMVLGLVHIQPAKGEACTASTWVDTDEDDTSRLILAVHFDNSDGSIDGASASLDGSRVPSLFNEAVQQIELTNDTSVGDPVLLESHPTEGLLVVDGTVTWSEVSSRVHQMAFEQVCWRLGGTTEYIVECEKVADAYIEFDCAESDIDAGAVGIASWVSSPAGDTLCMMP
ncbi:MAG: hypothetical protein GXP62_00180 [Oligoflexia bacterium]|nr:hypothetical protein [Oligoflexia bacterium]